ncbi:MAG: Gfo/Idh/MocA family oxidoreductase [Planctomycetaceae bacterium]|nr:Gfo/Idh/MocA family oxidoreductase [Planctomycetaceae bacterium]
MNGPIPESLRLPYVPTLSGPFPGAIGLIACGGITEHHLVAYRKLGYPVLSLCDIDLGKAELRRAQYFPAAETTTDFQVVLRDPRITIVDIATHPDVRPAIVAAALRAGKHVLSQKPFVEDLAVGEELVKLAQVCDRRLAVNQNARWAPHFSYARAAVRSGVLGHLNSIRFQLHWDHTWTRGTPFEEIHHLLLYDFAIHWFDLIAALMPNRPWRSVHASVASTRHQNMRPPLLAQVMVQFDDAQVSLCLNGDSRYLPVNETYLSGHLGSLHSTGPDYSEQTVTVAVDAGQFQVPLVGGWFPDGFGGAMTELANSILESREPEHSARQNLDSLALCFAALKSADERRIVENC